MGRVFPAVAMAAMMVVLFLCSSNCRASILIMKAANATYGGCGGGGGECLGITTEVEAEAVKVELMVGSLSHVHVARFLDFKDNKPKTDQTKNRNEASCRSGAGNPKGACNGNPKSKKNCRKYAGSATC